MNELNCIYLYNIVSFINKLAYLINKDTFVLTFNCLYFFKNFYLLHKINLIEQESAKIHCIIILGLIYLFFSVSYLLSFPFAMDLCLASKY